MEYDDIIIYAPAVALEGVMGKVLSHIFWEQIARSNRHWDRQREIVMEWMCENLERST